MTAYALEPWLLQENSRLVLLRALLLLVPALVVLSSDRSGPEVTSLVAMIVAAMLGSVPLAQASLARAQPAVEAALAGVIVSSNVPLDRALLPYLLAAPLVAGLRFGVISAMATASAAIAASLIMNLLRYSDGLNAYVADATGWWLSMVAVALLAGWVRRARVTARPLALNDGPYVAAYRLLSQLRTVSRQLSGSLDHVSVGDTLLDRLRDVLPFDRAALLVCSHGSTLTPLSQVGGRAVWPHELGADSLIAEVWSSEQPRTGDIALTNLPASASAVLPLRIGLRTFGLVGLERETGTFDADRLKEAMSLVDESALRIETAMLFDEVRTLATTDERNRLAREIHDGIAQELASLGYAIDELADDARHLPGLLEGLRGLRTQLSGLITELRLSIFDLRSDTQSSASLGTSLSEYVRQVGARSSLTVHLMLDETPARLRVETETELLRIAQEAITNARKHAQAQNLWVSCTVAPPRAQVVVEDDGLGLGRARDDSFGLHMMRERARRIGGRLSVEPRLDGGTKVLVEVAPGTTLRTPRSEAVPHEGGAR